MAGIDNLMMPHRRTARTRAEAEVRSKVKRLFDSALSAHFLQCVSRHSVSLEATRTTTSAIQIISVVLASSLSNHHANPVRLETSHPVRKNMPQFIEFTISDDFMDPRMSQKSHPSSTDEASGIILTSTYARFI
jgi:hypothetical protein